MKINHILEAAKLEAEHIVLVVKQATWLPGIGSLAAGVHHIDADVRLFVKKFRDVKALAVVEVHKLAGDTEAVLGKLHDKAQSELAEVYDGWENAKEELAKAERKLAADKAHLVKVTEEGVKHVEAESISIAAHIIQDATVVVDQSAVKVAEARKLLDSWAETLASYTAKAETAAARLPDAVKAAADEAKAAAEKAAKELAEKVAAEAAASAKDLADREAAAQAAAAKVAADEAEAVKAAADAAAKAAASTQPVEAPVVTVAPAAPVEAPAVVVVADDQDPMHQA